MISGLSVYCSSYLRSKLPEFHSTLGYIIQLMERDGQRRGAVKYYGRPILGYEGDI
jgi:hypothetical protein